MRPFSKTGNYISGKIGKAIADHKLIEDGDRILMAVSGGKDSMAMTHFLRQRQKWAPVKYHLVAMHIETDHACADCAHRKYLEDFFNENGLEYHFEKISVLDESKKTSCFWCSWNRRKALFLAADKLKCNKIAFGHHMDDIVETLLLNMFYQGEFSGMNPRQELFKGKITIIRPLCYVEEDKMRTFASEAGFEHQICRCPNSEVSKRRVMKDLIGSLEKDCKDVRINLYRSMTRINEEYLKV